MNDLDLANAGFGIWAVIALIIATLLITGCTFEVPEDIQVPPYINIQNQNSEKTTSLTIASWNLQIFGDTKANNETLLNQYVDIINDYDIIFLQEIRDEDGTAPQKLINKLPEYNCKLSSRAGSTTMKEQYLLCYKDIKLDLFEDYNLNPTQISGFERPPIQAQFSKNNLTFTIYGVHIDPDKVETELQNLFGITAAPNSITIGDLNADCAYYNPTTKTIFDKRIFNWLITDDQDTTSGTSNCAYDRIIVAKHFNQHIGNSGIRTTPKEMSDHYLIWMRIET